jgi:hypothetical protein
MNISPNSYEPHSDLRKGTLISNPHIVKSFDLTNIKSGMLTNDSLATFYPNIIYNKETGLFNGTYRDPRIRVNLWEDLKLKHPDLYQSQLADLNDSKPPTSKTMEEYKKFLRDHQLLINTMQVFQNEWRQLFKSALGIPDDHRDYKIILEWYQMIRKSLDFITDILNDGRSKDFSDESLADYHSVFVHSIMAMKSTGSLNDFQMIINHELKDAKLNNITFSQAKAYVDNFKFDTLYVYFKEGKSSYLKDVKGCICISNCEFDTINLDARCDLFSVEDSTINVIPEINVTNVVYLNNVKSNEPVNLNINPAEVLIFNNTNISDEMYDTVGSMVNLFDRSKNRNIILKSFEDVQTKVEYPDVHIHGSDPSKPSELIKGTFNKLFKMFWDDDSNIVKLFRYLNRNIVDDFVIYTNDFKMLELVFKKTEGKKYGDIPASMFFLLKNLLNK